jgi:glycosyltransferase involved in cell wall biosynthesis
MKLSAVIITFNEERNISRCLSSLQGVADEIVVVDSLSTDKTVEICQSWGARVTVQQWLGYGAQKNLANSLTQYPYILSLDADEALSEPLKKSILEIKAHLPMADAYKMNRLTNYCGKWIKHCGWYPDTKIRLWNKEKAAWDLNKVHENLQVAPDSVIRKLSGDILHYTYHSISDHIATTNMYSTYAAENYFSKRKKCSWMKIIFAPVWGFIRDYFFKLGLLDGYYGFVVCKIASFTIFLKYVKLRQLYRDAS